MDEYKVFTTCFPYYAWIAFVFAGILANRLPHLVEHTRRAGKVYASKIRMAKANLTHHWSIYVNKIDDTSRQAGFYQYSHKHLRTKDLCMCRFPDDCIAAHSWCS